VGGLRVNLVLVIKVNNHSSDTVLCCASFIDQITVK
jgi:hypothetical protein